MYFPYSQTYFVHIRVLPVDGISLSFIKNILSWIKSQEAGPETDTLVEVIYSENGSVGKSCEGVWGRPAAKQRCRLKLSLGMKHKKAETES